MKKIIKIALIALLSIWLFQAVNAAKTVIVSAVVWNINQAPIISSVTPSQDPFLIPNNTSQNYKIIFTDNEKDNIYYTISVDAWWGFVNTSNWNITSFDANNQAELNFTYLAPATVPTPKTKKITVTLSDWPNLVTKTMSVYILN